MQLVPVLRAGPGYSVRNDLDSKSPCQVFQVRQVLINTTAKAPSRKLPVGLLLHLVTGDCSYISSHTPGIDLETATASENTPATMIPYASKCAYINCVRKAVGTGNHTPLLKGTCLIGPLDPYSLCRVSQCSVR